MSVSVFLYWNVSVAVRVLKDYFKNVVDIYAMSCVLRLTVAFCSHGLPRSVVVQQQQ